ncbi:tetratricopeptide repeat protein [Leptospira vanthielii]|uniref:Tetratricopeptide repeat protein n=1 Tax=Leptospira vanthielii serovar Holland str. Waz Holland = ATCC 700522 TaxID=1218591 RepID=N1WEF3_9LEPT|nr:hypothetical protein [Leptospira vanthielii]EMY71770.1 tetratricopeptide repeat protein [Leptospira vanthielii serovar Holland str. Waz Holland = ATCC 700522]
MKFRILYILFFCFIFILVGCRYPIAKQEDLESDSLFLEVTGSSATECNAEGIRLAKTIQLDQAEQVWDKCIQTNPNEVVVHLNRLRFYFLLDEYELLKQKIAKEAPSRSSVTYTNILKELEVRLRNDERVVLLDALSRVKGWELYSYEELANYYLQTGNFAYAEGYFNQILEVVPFHENALYGMADIQVQKGNWYSLLDYAKSLEVASKKNKEFHFYFVKANYELGRYEEALKWAESATPSEKTQISFLEVWRDTLLVLKDFPRWDGLLPYYRKAVEKGFGIPESTFFPTFSKEGKDVRKASRSGRS